MNRMYGRTFRTYSFERIMQDLANAKKYGAKYIAFFKTTPVFKVNFALVNLLRVLVLRPYYRIKNRITSIGKTELDIFKRDMKRYVEMNAFFDRK